MTEVRAGFYQSNILIRILEKFDSFSFSFCIPLSWNFSYNFRSLSKRFDIFIINDCLIKNTWETKVHSRVHNSSLHKSERIFIIHVNRLDYTSQSHTNRIKQRDQHSFKPLHTALNPCCFSVAKRRCCHHMLVLRGLTACSGWNIFQ